MESIAIIEFLAKSKVVKTTLTGLVCGIVLFTLAASIYIPFHYAAVMPRSPQPESGRIYRITAQYGAVVYVNRQELGRCDFVKYDLTTASGVGVLALFFLGSRLGWFGGRARFDRSAH
jgi:hypothetical protein